MSNTSDANRGGNTRGGRRNTQGKGDRDNYQAKGGAQQQQPRAEPIKITDNELKTKLQVVFHKFVKD